ncbi:hypothetical protein [Hydrogenimonas sp.]
MARWLTILFFLFSSLFGETVGNDFSRECLTCHEKTAPPLSLVYRRYLMLYSSKRQIERRMIDFLKAPSKEKSSMPEGMKNRFNPQLHPSFDEKVAEKAVEKVIEKEDPIKRIVVKPPKEAPRPSGSRADRE